MIFWVRIPIVGGSSCEKEPFTFILVPFAQTNPSLGGPVNGISTCKLNNKELTVNRIKAIAVADLEYNHSGVVDGFKKLTSVDQGALHSKDDMEFQNANFIRDEPGLMVNIKRKVVQNSMYSPWFSAYSAHTISYNIFEIITVIQFLYKMMQLGGFYRSC